MAFRVVPEAGEQRCYVGNPPAGFRLHVLRRGSTGGPAKGAALNLASVMPGDRVEVLLSSEGRRFGADGWTAIEDLGAKAGQAVLVLAYSEDGATRKIEQLGDLVVTAMLGARAQAILGSCGMLCFGLPARPPPPQGSHPKRRQDVAAGSAAKRRKLRRPASTLPAPPTAWADGWEPALSTGCAAELGPRVALEWMPVAELAESRVAESRVAESRVAESRVAESRVAELAESRVAELAESRVAECVLALEWPVAELAEPADLRLACIDLAWRYSPLGKRLCQKYVDAATALTCRSAECDLAVEAAHAANTTMLVACAAVDASRRAVCADSRAVEVATTLTISAQRGMEEMAAELAKARCAAAQLSRVKTTRDARLLDSRARLADAERAISNSGQDYMAKIAVAQVAAVDQQRAAAELNRLRALADECAAVWARVALEVDSQERGGDE
jgi:hypothetical protein